MQTKVVVEFTRLPFLGRRQSYIIPLSQWGGLQSFKHKSNETVLWLMKIYIDWGVKIKYSTANAEEVISTGLLRLLNDWKLDLLSSL